MSVLARAVAVAVLVIPWTLMPHASAQVGRLGARDPVPQPPLGRAVIVGRVTAAEDGRPLHRARVSIHADNGRIYKALLADRDGRFEFAELPAGRFIVSASHAGYVGLQHGQRAPGDSGTAIVVGDRERVTVDLPLPRGAVVTGVVTDEFGQPVVQAQVRAFQLVYRSRGQREPMPFQATTADERGVYRLFGLPPGDYLVSTSLQTFMGGLGPQDTTPTTGYPDAFYPGTHDIDAAQPVTLRVADELFLPLALIPARLHRITGAVRTADGFPASGANVSLTTRRGGNSGFVRGHRVGANGTFALDGVTAGAHVLTVRLEPRNDGPGEIAVVPITMDGRDLEDLQITTSRGATVRGRVVFDGATPRPDALRVYPRPLENGSHMHFVGGASPTQGIVDADGRFELAGIGAPMVPTPTTPEGWQVRSITWNGKDISDEGIDPAESPSVDGVVITLVDRLTRLSGVTRDAAGRPVAGAVVVILSSRALRDGSRPDPLVVRADTHGGLDLAGLRPGRYVAAAVEWLEPGSQFTPDVQERLRRGGRPFTLREGERLTLDLRVDRLGLVAGGSDHP